MKSDTLINASIVVIALCAVTLTALRFRDAHRMGNELIEPSRTAVVKEWQSYLGRGPLSVKAKVFVIEFADFQCPACAILAQHIRAVRNEYGDTVQFVYRHFPLKAVHPAALSAAIAAECSKDQARFERMHDVMYQSQADLGIKPWSEFAQAADVPDLDEFQACVNTGLHADAIAADTIAGHQLQIRATPTFLINEMEYVGAPDLQTFRALIRRAINKPK